MIKNKSRKHNPETWYIYAAAHSVIHGGLVGFFTGSFILAIAETVCHAVIDNAKCTGKIDLKIDQLLHIVCKAVWIFMMVKGYA